MGFSLAPDTRFGRAILAMLAMSDIWTARIASTLYGQLGATQFLLENDLCAFEATALMRMVR